MTTLAAPSEKTSWKFLLGFVILALFFAFIIDKEVTFPTPVLVAGAGLAGLALFLSAFIRPEIPLYVLLVYIPFNRLLIGDFGGAMTALNVTNILCIIAFLACLSPSTQGRNYPPASSLHIPIILFAVLGMLSFVRGSWEYGSWYLWNFINPLKRWLTPILFYALALCLIRDRKILKTSVIIIMVTVTLAGLMAIKDYIDIGQVGSIEKARVGGIADQPNMLSAFFCYYMFLTGGFFLMNYQKPKYWLLLIPFLICFRGIQVTFSRGGYLAFFAGAFALVFFRNKIFCILAIFLAVLAFLNPAILPSGINYRLLSTFQNVDALDEGDLTNAAYDVYKGKAEILDGSARGRLEIWKGAVKMISENPLGTGYGTFTGLIPYYAPKLQGARMDAHNNYLLVAAEMGIPALLVMLWVFVAVMFKIYWLYRHARDPFHKAVALGFLAGMFGLLMSNMFGSRLDSQEVSGYFWVLSAVIVRAIAFERSDKTPATVKSVSDGTREKKRRGNESNGFEVSQSLTQTLRRFDEMKYGENERPLSD